MPVSVRENVHCPRAASGRIQKSSILLSSGCFHGERESFPRFQTQYIYGKEMEQGILAEFPHLMADLVLLAGCISIQPDLFEVPAVNTIKHHKLQQLLHQFGQEFVETCTKDFFAKKK